MPFFFLPLPSNLMQSHSKSYLAMKDHLDFCEICDGKPGRRSLASPCEMFPLRWPNRISKLPFWFHNAFLRTKFESISRAVVCVKAMCWIIVSNRMSKMVSTLREMTPKSAIIYKSVFFCKCVCVFCQIHQQCVSHSTVDVSAGVVSCGLTSFFSILERNFFWCLNNMKKIHDRRPLEGRTGKKRRAVPNVSVAAFCHLLHPQPKWRDRVMTSRLAAKSIPGFLLGTLLLLNSQNGAMLSFTSYIRTGRKKNVPFLSPQHFGSVARANETIELLSQPCWFRVVNEATL